MKKNNVRKLSRRRFFAVGSIGAAGLWASSSQQASARMVRGLVSEARRNVLEPSFVPDPKSWDPNRITAAWLGHSTVLLNFYGVTILTDPLLGKRAGADTLVGTVGVKRLIAPALKARQLPRIDLVLLSHAHMDHLNPATIRVLPGEPRAVTAHATDDLLLDCGLRSVDSLRWGESARISTDHGDVAIEAFQVRHWGARWKVDKFRGYNGYTIEREGKKIIFGGDTAWTSTFKSLRSRGPFEFALMPIGAYQPWLCSHCTPEQAVQMTNDAGVRHLLPIHFKTFPFGREGVREPMERLENAIESERIGWRDVGQTFQA